MLKSNIIWPNSRRYKSKTDWEPLGFFSECLCNAKKFDLMLGYFSSSAISVLSYSFAACMSITSYPVAATHTNCNLGS